MRLASRLLLLLAVTSLSTAWAEDDDLAPIPTKPKSTPPKPKPAPKPAPVKPPPPKPAPKPDEDVLAPIPTEPGTLSIKVAANLSDATYSVDGKEVGSVSRTSQLSPGEHLIVVKRLGYANFAKRVAIPSGKPFELTATLEPAYAIISVNSDVAGAQVFINGRFMGAAPQRNLEVPPGQLELKVRKDGYKEDNQLLTVVAGKEYPITVHFTPATAKVIAATGGGTTDAPTETPLKPKEPTPEADTDLPDPNAVAVADRADAAPITTKWYFWTGVVLLVAAAAVGTVFGIDSFLRSKDQVRIQLNKDCAKAGHACDAFIDLPVGLFAFPMGR